MQHHKTLRHLTLLLAFCFSLILTSCAKDIKPSSPDDPYEGFNRRMYSVSNGVDKMLIKPIALGYNKIIPTPLLIGINNGFDNFNTVGTINNDILQGKISYMMSDTWRLLINSTLGLGGLIDMASRIGLPKHSEDFGLTLAYWSNTDASPYTFLPFIGPSTNRDDIGSLGDIFFLAAWRWIHPYGLEIGLYAFEALNKRVKYLSADQLVAQSFDPYIFIRDAYLQTRDKEISENKDGHNYPYKNSKQLATASNAFAEDWDE